MGQNEKKSDIHLVFSNISNIHFKVIYSCRGHKNRLTWQISGHLVLLPRFWGCLKLKRGENLDFFMSCLNWKISKPIKDIKKWFSVPSIAI